MKKSCLYYFDLKRFFGKRLIAIDHVIQNNTDLINISNVIRDRRPVNLVNDIDSDRRDSSVYHTNDDSTGNKNKEKDGDLEDPRPEKADLHRQNQRTLCVALNTKYYNFLYHL